QQGSQELAFARDGGSQLSTFGQVSHATDHADRPAVLVTDHMSTILHIGPSAVFPGKPILHRPLRTRTCLHSGDGLLYQRQVVWMDEPCPAVDTGSQLGRGVAEKGGNAVTP